MYPDIGPVSRTKTGENVLAFHAIFNGFYLKNKAGLTGNFVHMKNSYKRREQLCKRHGPVVPGEDNAIHRINQYPVDSIVCFVSTYPGW